MSSEMILIYILVRWYIKLTYIQCSHITHLGCVFMRKRGGGLPSHLLGDLPRLYSSPTPFNYYFIPSNLHVVVMLIVCCLDVSNCWSVSINNTMVFSPCTWCILESQFPPSDETLHVGHLGHLYYLGYLCILALQLPGTPSPIHSLSPTLAYLTVCVCVPGMVWSAATYAGVGLTNNANDATSSA